MFFFEFFLFLSFNFFLSFFLFSRFFFLPFLLSDFLLLLLLVCLNSFILLLYSLLFLLLPLLSHSLFLFLPLLILLLLLLLPFILLLHLLLLPLLLLQPLPLLLLPLHLLLLLPLHLLLHLPLHPRLLLLILLTLRLPLRSHILLLRRRQLDLLLTLRQHHIKLLLNVTQLLHVEGNLRVILQRSVRIEQIHQLLRPGFLVDNILDQVDEELSRLLGLSRVQDLDDQLACLHALPDVLHISVDLGLFGSGVGALGPLFALADHVSGALAGKEHFLGEEVVVALGEGGGVFVKGGEAFGPVLDAQEEVFEVLVAVGRRFLLGEDEETFEDLLRSVDDD